MVNLTPRNHDHTVTPPQCPNCHASLDVMHVVQHWEFLGKCRDVLACPTCGTTLGYAIPQPGKHLSCCHEEPLAAG